MTSQHNLSGRPWPPAQPHQTTLAYTAPFVKRKVRRAQNVRFGRAAALRWPAPGETPGELSVANGPARCILSLSGYQES